jgi:cysteinyl-tRNA synthetase
MPRATENIAPMIDMIKALIANGHAYIAGDDERGRHVLFNILSKPDYGKLSRRSQDEMIAGARVDVAPFKWSPMDFVLWKPSDANTPGWDSPWGRGRPGWHLECSAMIESTFHTETIDIHGGGIDLVFPHHENEIAQSRCSFHTDVMANYWMHNGFLQVEGEKMSKSLGNFFTIHDLLKDWPGEVLRFNMLRTHYRQPIDWTVKGLEESWKTLDDWYWIVADAPGETPSGLVLDALCDDLNTHQVITVLHGLRNRAQGGDETARGELAASLHLLGFLRESAAQWAARRQTAANIDAAKVQSLIDARSAARKAKDFKESDRLRDELAAMGVVLKDSKDGTTWEVAR